VVSPSDGSANISRQPTLEWSANDPDNDSLTYDIRLEKGNSAPETTVVTNHGSTTYTPNVLAYSSTYFWQVIVTDEHGATAAGPVWEFSTVPSPVDMTISSTNSPLVAGDTLEIDARVENTGSESVTETLEVDVGAIGSESTTVSLSGGETQTQTFTFSTTTEDAGSYSTIATTEDSIDSLSVELLEPATCNVSIARSTEPITEGQPLEVTAEVMNIGDVDTTCSLTLDAGTLGSSTASVDVSQSGSALKTLAVPSDTGDADTYTATVSSADDSANISADVLPPAEVSANGDQISSDGKATISITAGGVETLEIKAIWLDWTLADNSVEGGNINNKISTQGEISITYDSLVSSVSPSLTFDLPTRYVGGKYVLQIRGSNIAGLADDTAIITVQ